MTFLPLYNLLKSLAKHELFFYDILLITEISAHNRELAFQTGLCFSVVILLCCCCDCLVSFFYKSTVN